MPRTPDVPIVNVSAGQIGTHMGASTLDMDSLSVVNLHCDGFVIDNPNLIGAELARSTGTVLRLRKPVSVQ